MRPRVSTLASLALVVGLVFVATAEAGGPSRSRLVVSGPAIGVFPGAPPAIAPSFAFREVPPFKRVRVAGFGRFTTFAAPVAYVAPPVLYDPPAYFDPRLAYGPPAYFDPRLAYGPPPAEAPPPVAPPPPPPPERDVIQYSDGRYELRGDGISVPYRWVWIPSAPPPPGSRPEARLYGWTDEQGALHVTDRLDAVPERYRAQAKRNQSS